MLFRSSLVVQTSSINRGAERAHLAVGAASKRICVREGTVGAELIGALSCMLIGVLIGVLKLARESAQNRQAGGVGRGDAPLSPIDSECRDRLSRVADCWQR